MYALQESHTTLSVSYSLRKKHLAYIVIFLFLEVTPMCCCIILSVRLGALISIGRKHDNLFHLIPFLYFYHLRKTIWEKPCRRHGYQTPAAEGWLLGSLSSLTQVPLILQHIEQGLIKS